MFKLDLEKAEDQRSNCQHLLDENSRKTSTSASLTMLKSQTVQITKNCGKFLEMGIPDNLTCLPSNLYAGQEATVRTAPGAADWFQFRKEVCQGCILSPCLFNLYAEYLLGCLMLWAGAQITFLFFPKECSNYCIITLISYANKVMLKILQARLQQYVNHELPDVQVGF